MSDLYKKAKAGRLTFKGGDVATLESKKKKKKRKHNKNDDAAAAAAAADNDPDLASAAAAAAGEPDDSTAAEAVGDVYTIDAAKKMKYEEIFPVEAEKFGYDPANNARSAAASKSVEDALDDRVKKKADRYCK